MADVDSFDGVSADALTEAQLRAILYQIDLDIYNLMRDGKLAAVRHQQYGPEGGEVDRKAGLDGLLAARKMYQSLLDSIPVEIISQYDDPGM